jgi:hypothetical protein
MKRNASLRLKLHRETLRVLASPELEGAQGGFYTITLQTIVTCDRISCGGTCGAVSCGATCNSALCQSAAC